METELFILKFYYWTKKHNAKCQKKKNKNPCICKLRINVNSEHGVLKEMENDFFTLTPTLFFKYF